MYCYSAVCYISKHKEKGFTKFSLEWGRLYTHISYLDSSFFYSYKFKEAEFGKSEDQELAFVFINLFTE